MPEWSEIVLRLGVATLACGAIGLNRDLHGKPIGLRTLGLVGLATALIVLFVSPHTLDPEKFSDASSRVIQGILTGIGFLGAGVIVHADQQSKVHGLTSAACVWFTACIGIVCGAGQWRMVAVAMVIAFVLLLIGAPVEDALRNFIDARKGNRPAPPRADTPPD